MDTIVNQDFISKITAKEKEITHQDDVTADGPTAFAEKHMGEALNAQNVLHDITEGEKHVTHEARPTKHGPTAIAQSILAKAGHSSGSNDTQQKELHTGRLDRDLISKITEAEKKITHSEADVVAGGPTAVAQRHAGQHLSAQGVLHDITEGEKKITGEARAVAGGPTAVAQSELTKATREGAAAHSKGALGRNNGDN